jgi:hypothetical protein
LIFFSFKVAHIHGCSVELGRESAVQMLLVCGGEICGQIFKVAFVHQILRFVAPLEAVEGSPGLGGVSGKGLFEESKKLIIFIIFIFSFIICYISNSKIFQ